MPKAQATLAQSVEQLPRKEQVRSSILLGGSNYLLARLAMRDSSRAVRMVMSSRPCRIVADVKVPLTRPRSIRELQTSDDFHHTYTQVWKHLEAGWVHHEG